MDIDVMMSLLIVINDIICLWIPRVDIHDMEKPLSPDDTGAMWWHPV
jgi:hypothetical protein